MNGLARCISLLCAAWLVFYICWGSTSGGKDWFQEMAAGDKAAVPVLTLCLPILVAGSACAVLLILTNNGSMYGIMLEGGGKRRPKKSDHHNSMSSTLPHQLPAWIHRFYHQVCSLRQEGRGGLLQSFRAPKPPCFRVGGDAQMGVIAVLFLVLPLVLYTIATIHRHLSGSNNEDEDNKVMEIGNAFGMAAMVAMSYVLIPVSRHSPLLQQMTSWSPAHAIYLHHVAGRLVVIGGLLHGGLHVYRWVAIQGHGFLEMILPPAQCWTIYTNDENQDDDSCYTQFRNLTGSLAGVALVVLAITTTFSIIRRRFYTIFWKSHVVAAPLLYCMVILHYEKAILYVAGGVLYYLATTMPIWLETRSSNNTMYTSFSSLRCSSSSSNQKEDVFGVPIVAVQRIPSGNGGGHDVGTDTTTTSACIMSVTIQVDPVALERFRPGQYVRLLAPDISILAHPFTINMCPLSIRRRQELQQPQQNRQGDANMTTNETDELNGGAAAGAGAGHDCYMQIIFHATGNFTKQLAQRLLLIQTENAMLPERPQPLPVQLRLDGFYGPSNRLRTALLQHDVILIVAGGIGITPYLSLLHQLHENLVASYQQDKQQQQQSLMLQVTAAAAAAAESRHHRFRTKRIVLHWMCRDAALIDYIKREYFAPLLDDTSTNSSNDLSDDNDFGIQLVIHQTGIPTRRLDTIKSSTTALFSNRDTRNPQDDDNGQNRTREQQEQERVILDRPVGGGLPFRPSKFSAGTKTSYLANAPLFLSFCLIGWIGLIIIWYCFNNFDSKNQVMPRSYSMTCVLILSFVIAAVLNRLFTPAWEDRREDSFYLAISTSAHNDDVDETFDYDEEGTTAAVSMQGVELAKANASTALHQTEQEGLNDYRTGSDGLLRGALDDSSLGDGGSGSALVTLEERCGRPNVREFLHVLDSRTANHPAVYACGPNNLTRSIRVAVNERHCRVCFCKIAFYQERFEL